MSRDQPGVAMLPHRAESAVHLDQPDLLLVGCVKKKRSGRWPARDLYESALFRGRRRRAEEASVPWYILSAEHGLIHPGQEIGYYDTSLLRQGVAARRAWSARVLGALLSRHPDLSGLLVEIHAGAAYRDHGLVKGLRAHGASVAVPLAGLVQGKQLAWYSERY